MSLIKKSTGTAVSLFKKICALPAVLVGMVVSSNAFATGSDLLAPGDATVAATFGSDGTIWKWLIIAEIAAAIIAYIARRTFTAFFGVIGIAVFLNVALLIAGY